MSRKESCDEKTARLLKEQQKKFKVTMDNTSQLKVLNEFIDKASEVLVCGPECQAEKEEKALLQRYHLAQTNLVEGPGNLEDTSKTYYTFSEGGNYFREFSDDKLRDVADKIADEYESLFTDLSETTRMLIRMHKNNEVNFDHSINYNSELEKQTNNLEGQIRDTKSDVATNDRKAYYRDQEMETLDLWYKVYYYIFIVILVVYALCAFLAKSNVEFRFVVLRFAFLLVLFFFGYHIVVKIFHLINYTISLLPTNSQLYD